MYKAGNIPNAYALPTGTIIIDEVVKTTKPEWNITYARVSSSGNKEYLLTQSERLATFCLGRGLTIHQSIKETGSGLNDKRPQLLKILEQGKATKLIVEHRDRLTRFGFNYIKACCDKMNCEIVVVNEVNDDKRELIDDFIAVITSFCARIYGLRRGQRKKFKLKEVLDESD